MDRRSQKKRVRFAKTHDTYTIERRGTHRQPIVNSHTPTSVPSVLDDEVKDHPVFASPTPVLSAPADRSAMAMDIRRQLSCHPHCTAIHNPLTGRQVTRFGSNYWKLLEQVFGRSSDIFGQERDEYNRTHKKS